MDSETFFIDNLEQTEQLAQSVARSYKNKGGVIALIGVLGAGKTTFTKAFAKALGIKENIISPTFVLIRQHLLPDSDRQLYHIDLYRLENPDPKEIGLAELFDLSEDIILIEWANKLNHNQYPKNTKFITIEQLPDNKRKFTFS